MPLISQIFNLINKAKITQRDRFFLYFLGMLVLLVHSVTGLILALLAKQIPDLVQWVITEILKRL